jgi:flagellar biosynthetic protein FliP
MKNNAPVLLVQGSEGLQLPQPALSAKNKTRKLSKFHKKILIFSAVFLILAIMSGTATAAGTLNDMVSTLFGENAQTVDIIILLTILTLLPSILLMMTSFMRIVIVISFVRNALGVQQAPPNQVVIGIALFLTFFVMHPFLVDIYHNAYVPFTEEEITQEEFLDEAVGPLREFMFEQTHTSDLHFFIGLSANEDIDAADEETIPTHVLIPAFITSELRAAFVMGFLLYIPFIVIDMIVASILMSMGMMMLPPAMISLPFKILLFVLVDGWQLVLGQIVTSFRGIGS